MLFYRKGTKLFFIRGGKAMNDQNLIIENMDNPHELERMYRKDPKAFKKVILTSMG